jgi:pimeloyl-ACP methyl ester carboxylesterase
MLSISKPTNIIKKPSLKKEKKRMSFKTEEPPEIFKNLIKHQKLLVETLKVDEGYCEVEKNVKIYYQLYGNGPKKVFFVIGLNCTHHIWLHQAVYFALNPEYQVCIFDNRGIGASDKPIGHYSISLFAKDAAKLLNHLNWTTEIHLIGMSMGGMIAQKLCLDYPARFETLTLTSTYHSAIAALPTAKDIKFAAQTLTRPLDEWIKPLIEVTFPKCWRNQMEGDAMVKSDYVNYLMMDWFKNLPEQNPVTMHLQALAAINHNLMPFQLKKIRKSGIRCLVVHGGRDHVIRTRCGKDLAKYLNCKIVEFENGGHVLMLQDPDNYNAILRSHFENSELEALLTKRLETKNDNHLILKDQTSPASNSLTVKRVTTHTSSIKRARSFTLPKWITQKEETKDELKMQKQADRRNKGKTLNF